MEREIEFRIKDGEGNWHFGYPVFYDDGSFHFFDCDLLNRENPMYPIKLCYIVGTLDDTLGQYTGLKDKNGNKIYEGDIVKHKYDKSIVRYGRIGYDSGVGLAGFSLQDIDCDGELREMELDYGTKEQFFNCDRCIDLTQLEVIGNIYDNKELLN